MTRAWTREGLEHQPYFCEENVWHLLRSAKPLPPAVHAVFVTGPSGRVVMARQRAAPPGSRLAWDYHVFVLWGRGAPATVLDLDTRLDFPCDAAVYLEESFPRGVDPSEQPLFRPIAGETYLRTLETDRRHMVDAHGRYTQPAPSWPLLTPGRSNLSCFTDIHDERLGSWLDLPQFHLQFCA
ncbi:MAG: hypothetical protein HC923_08240 [Myxococcales bacterium]|nr:hypothetical protein [Myxococcales bacterium]